MAAAMGIVLLIPLHTATAHHSAAMFDHSKTLTLHGTVKNFQFTNPHSWLIVMVTGTDGTPISGASRQKAHQHCSMLEFCPSHFGPATR